MYFEEFLVNFKSLLDELLIGFNKNLSYAERIRYKDNVAYFLNYYLDTISINYSQFAWRISTKDQGGEIKFTIFVHHSKCLNNFLLKEFTYE